MGLPKLRGVTKNSRIALHESSLVKKAIEDRADALGLDVAVYIRNALAQYDPPLVDLIKQRHQEVKNAERSEK